MEFHEAANIFPLDEEHLDELAEDIRQHGLTVQIKTYHGQIIDGRRRSIACERAGVEPTYHDVTEIPPRPSHQTTRSGWLPWHVGGSL